ncbi:barstar family protein [Streptomyces sp. ISL-66]
MRAQAGQDAPDFWRVAGESIGCGGCFGRNFDAFADCLRGGDEGL